VLWKTLRAVVIVCAGCWNFCGGAGLGDLSTGFCGDDPHGLWKRVRLPFACRPGSGRRRFTTAEGWSSRASLF